MKEKGKITMVWSDGAPIKPTEADKKILEILQKKADIQSSIDTPQGEIRHISDVVESLLKKLNQLNNE